MGRKSAQHIREHGGIAASSVAGPGSSSHYEDLSKAALADKIGHLETQLKMAKNSAGPKGAITKKQLWNRERRMIRNNLWLKGYKKNKYPPGSKPPHGYGVANLLHLLQNAALYKAAPGFQRIYNNDVADLRKNLPGPKNKKPKKFQRPREVDETDVGTHYISHQGKKAHVPNYPKNYKI